MTDLFPFPRAYAQFLAQYHGSRDFFECHDIMEEHWKEHGLSRYAGCWLVFVRISVACYHARRGNWAGARKLMAKAVAEVDPVKMSELGLDGEKLALMMSETCKEWHASELPVYRDLDLPIVDPRLTREGIRICLENGWVWSMPSSQADDFIIHKHLRRDRTKVVETRKRAAEMKKRTRGQ